MSEQNNNFSRRVFIRVTGTLIIGAGANVAMPPFIQLADGRTGMAVSGGYLLVDEKKCQGCVSCMLACSLVNEGMENLSLSRIQVIQNSFERWPNDLNIEQCRQCVDPKCVKACPEEALSVDPKFGNVRRIIDVEKCIGCGQCVDACPYTPSRTMVVQDGRHDGDYKARKCDLCADAPYHWDSSGGGPQGKQACVEICPVKAIQFTTQIPEQKGESGYKVNLRDARWGKLGFPTT